MKIEIVSGEGTGSGHVERYEGRATRRAIRARLTRERAGGDRWAFVRIDGRRVDASDDHALTVALVEAQW